MTSVQKVHALTAAFAKALFPCPRLNNDAQECAERRRLAAMLSMHRRRDPVMERCVVCGYGNPHVPCLRGWAMVVRPDHTYFGRRSDLFLAKHGRGE